MKPLIPLALLLLAPLAPAADDIGGDAVPVERTYELSPRAMLRLPTTWKLGAPLVQDSSRFSNARLPADLLGQINTYRSLVEYNKLTLLDALFMSMSRIKDKPEGWPEVWAVRDGIDLTVISTSQSKTDDNWNVLKYHSRSSDKANTNDGDAAIALPCSHLLISEKDYHAIITIWHQPDGTVIVQREQALRIDGQLRPFVGDRSKVAKPAEGEKPAEVKPEGKAE